MKQYLLKPFFLTIVFLYPFLKIFSCENDIWGKVYCDGKAVPDSCINAGDGYFIFDLVHIKKYDYWSDLKVGLDSYLKNKK